MAESISPTIFLVKETIQDSDKIFKEPDSLQKVANEGKILYYRRSHPNTPKWFGFVGNNFDVSSSIFFNSSSFAAIVLEIQGRLFVIPLGMGIHLIEMGTIEYNFGMRVVINCLPQNEIRQMDTTTPEYNSQKTKKSAVKNSNPEELGINKRKDILKGLGGKLQKGHPFGERIQGKDSFRPSKKIENLDELEKICAEALNISKSDAYKSNYGWIDNMALVDDPELKKELNSKLIKTLKDRKEEGIFLAPPDFIEDVTDFEGFVFSGNNKRLSKKTPVLFPQIRDFYEDFGYENLGKLNLEIISKTCKMYLRDNEGKHYQSWHLFRCIVWEVEGDHNNKFILSEGSWYEIEKGFYEETEKFFDDKIITDSALLPAGNREKEAEYNKRICASKTHYYLFDLGCPEARGKSIGPDKNELCDILDVHEKRFIHIKKGKSSQDLGHLFNQGKFSARMLKLDKKIRDEARSHFQSYHIDEGFLPEAFNPSDYWVIYGAIVGFTQTKDIPFFSKVSFRDSLEIIGEMMGYKCGFTFIESNPEEATS